MVYPWTWRIFAHVLLNVAETLWEGGEAWIHIRLWSILQTQTCIGVCWGLNLLIIVIFLLSSLYWFILQSSLVVKSLIETAEWYSGFRCYHSIRKKRFFRSQPPYITGISPNQHQRARIRSRLTLTQLWIMKYFSIEVLLQCFHCFADARLFEALLLLLGFAVLWVHHFWRTLWRGLGWTSK